MGSFLLGIFSFGYTNAIQCAGDPKNNNPFDQATIKLCIKESIEYFNALSVDAREKIIRETREKETQENRIILNLNRWESPADVAKNQDFIDEVKKAGDTAIEKNKADLLFYLADKKRRENESNKKNKLRPWIFNGHNPKLKKTCQKIIKLGDNSEFHEFCSRFLSRRDIQKL